MFSQTWSVETSTYICFGIYVLVLCQWSKERSRIAPHNKCPCLDSPYPPLPQMQWTLSGALVNMFLCDMCLCHISILSSLTLQVSSDKMSFGYLPSSLLQLPSHPPSSVLTMISLGNFSKRNSHACFKFCGKFTFSDFHPSPHLSPFQPKKIGLLRFSGSQMPQWFLL